MVLDKLVLSVLNRLEPKSNKVISKYLIKPTINTIPYALIGYLKTGKQQEKYAQQLGFSKLKLTNYSLVLGYVTRAVELGTKLSLFSILSSVIGDGFNDHYLTKISDNLINGWLFLVTLDIGARTAYSITTKKPIGSYFIEIPVYLKKKLFNHKELEEKVLETSYKTQETSMTN